MPDTSVSLCMVSGWQEVVIDCAIVHQSSMPQAQCLMAKLILNTALIHHRCDDVTISYHWLDHACNSSLHGCLAKWLAMRFNYAELLCVIVKMASCTMSISVTYGSMWTVMLMSVTGCLLLHKLLSSSTQHAKPFASATAPAEPSHVLLISTACDQI